MTQTALSPRRARRSRQQVRGSGPVLLAAWLIACSDPAPSTAPDTASAADVADSGGGGVDSATVGGWSQGYSITLDFVGGQAGGIDLDLDRDLYEIPTAFSFGSTHYVHGEVGFAVADTMTLKLDDGKGGTVDSQIEISFNFGLVVGSTVNPVHTDKAGPYPFSCQPPEIRIFFKNTQFRSNCAGLTGSVVLDKYANVTGGTIAGSFQGRLQAYYPQAGATAATPCDAAENAKMCSKPDRYVDVKGHFGFTLPAKADGGGGGSGGG